MQTVEVQLIYFLCIIWLLFATKKLFADPKPNECVSIFLCRTVSFVRWCVRYVGMLKLIMTMTIFMAVVMRIWFISYQTFLLSLITMVETVIIIFVPQIQFLRKYKQEQISKIRLRLLELPLSSSGKSSLLLSFWVTNVWDGQRREGFFREEIFIWKS